MIPAAAIAALAAVALAAGPQTTMTPELPGETDPTNEGGGTIWLWNENEPITVDVRGGDRLDLVMEPTERGTWTGVAKRCAWMGGRLVWTDDELVSASYVCEGVDF